MDGDIGDFRPDPGTGLLMGEQTEQLLHPMGPLGVYGRAEIYETLVEGLATLISSYRPRDAEVLRFPPVMSRADLEKSGYLGSFPNLLGCVCGLHGSEREVLAATEKHRNGAHWTAALSPSDLVLTPAACYPAYPIAAARGATPQHGWTFDVACECFRHEPSPHVDRLQSFRMREYVRMGQPQQVLDFRSHWMEQGRLIAGQLGLRGSIAAANDPFFGREGRMRAVSQVIQALKFELLIPIRSDEQPTACMSFNYHRDHFGTIWNLRDSTGSVSHTGCAAFGMDRLALAMFAAHGVDIRAWPKRIRGVLAL